MWHGVGVVKPRRWGAWGPERVCEGTTQFACGDCSLGVGVGSKLAPLCHEVGIEDGENAAVVAIALSRAEM